MNKVNCHILNCLVVRGVEGMQRHRFFLLVELVVNEIFMVCLKYASTINRKGEDSLNFHCN